MTNLIWQRQQVVVEEDRASGNHVILSTKSAAISLARSTRIERVSTLVEVLKDTWFEQRIKIHAQDDTHTSFPI